jgi:hypothetical protein
MNKYQGYLTGVNPNRLRKIAAEEKMYAYESATGTFVNGQGGEVKTMAAAIKKNEETEKELKEAWPPQKAIGAKNVSLTEVEKKIATMGDPKSNGARKAFVEKNKRADIEEEKKRQLRIKNHTKQQWGIQDKKLADLPIIKNNINYQKIPNQDLKSNMRNWIREADNEKEQNRIESDASVRRRVWDKVEKNRAKGKADYEDFAIHDIRIAEDVAGIKKLQKEVSDNLNAYLTDAVKDKRLVNYTHIPTPDFIKNPKPKSMGITNPDLVAERKIISEVLNEKD